MAPAYVAGIDGTRGRIGRAPASRASLCAVWIVAVSSGVGQPTREGALRKLLATTAQKIDALIEQRTALRTALAAECAAVAL